MIRAGSRSRVPRVWQLVGHFRGGAPNSSPEAQLQGLSAPAAGAGAVQGAGAGAGARGLCQESQSGREPGLVRVRGGASPSTPLLRGEGATPPPPNGTPQSPAGLGLSPESHVASSPALLCTFHCPRHSLGRTLHYTALQGSASPGASRTNAGGWQEWTAARLLSSAAAGDSTTQGSPNTTSTGSSTPRTNSSTPSSTSPSTSPSTSASGEEAGGTAAAQGSAPEVPPRSPPPATRAVQLQEVVIVGAARTAVGAFQGSLAGYSAPSLGGAAIAGALAKGGVAAAAVQEVIMGNVISAGVGQAPAKQAAMAAGIPDSAVCTTVNKVCSSGLKAVMLAAQSIALGAHSVVVAGGMESMSRAPFLLPRSANLHRAGALPLPDSVMQDGLQDPQRGYAMGVLAQHCADDLRISRDDQDEDAIVSYTRALAAEATGKFRSEIVSPVAPSPPPQPKGGEKHKAKSSHAHEPLLFDEGLKKFDPDKLRQLDSAFLPGGSITAGNSSTLADGAAAFVLTSAAYAAANNLPVLARIVGWADAEQDPERFPTSPSLAIPLALKSAGLQLKDAELFEINEAFAAVTLANASLLGLPRDQVNVHGGAVALGHPIGASGARILVSLLTALGYNKENVGVAAVCNGGGGASALVVERDPSFSIADHHHGLKPVEG